MPLIDETNPAVFHLSNTIDRKLTHEMTPNRRFSAAISPSMKARKHINMHLYL